MCIRDRLEIVNDTVGALAKRIREGEAFDLVVVSPAALDDLAKAGTLAGGARAHLARARVGVMGRALSLIQLSEPTNTSQNEHVRFLLHKKHCHRNIFQWPSATTV